MTRMIYCVKLNKESEGLEYAPMPGEKGQWLYENVSQEAWLQWQDHQTRLINEKRLNLLNIEDRNYINEQMDKYFSGKNFDAVEGYVSQ